MFRMLLPVVALLGATVANAADLPTNTEMTAMYEADQAARQVDKIDWAKLGPADESRRKRTRALLDAGELRSGTDYLHAAFIFQHGATASDILLAHVLALAAMKRGRDDASWIATATLDRYLQNIGQGQVFGTQFQCRSEGPTMEPYDPTLIPDSVREMMGVPVRAEQEMQGQGLCGHATLNTPQK